MWVLKLLVDYTNQLIGSVALKHNVSVASYSLSSEVRGKWLYTTGAGFVFGDDKDKRAFIVELTKRPEVINYEVVNDFGILYFKQPAFARAFWNPQIIQIEPIIINPGQDRQVWSFASFDRKVLENALKVAEKNVGAKLLHFKEEKISNISFTRLLPELTKNQKRALEIAIRNGYYDYPKKVNMETLASKMGISYSTYQAHLKKAEGKIVPNVYRDL